MILTHDPRTGAATETALTPTTPAGVAAAAAAAAAAATPLADAGRHRRADLLEAMAAAVEARSAELVSVADRETGLGVERLSGEIRRSAFQFRIFADAVRDGAYLEAAIDRAGDTPLGPAPDVRRMLIPLGPVAVFGSSNFPFAFSVLGGDVASALAAGCPVVIKAHSSHPETSALSFDVLRDAVAECGFPEGAVQIVFGRDAGGSLVAEPAVAAVGFTGSLTAAEALMEEIARRERPIPFFGELSSVNPLIVTPGAAEWHGDDIARGLFGSVTGSGGQLCTKPGIAFIPAGDAGDRLVGALAELIDGCGPAVLLNAGIAASYGRIRADLEASGARRVATGAESEVGYRVAPTLLETDAAGFGSELAEECFGPLVVLVRYDRQRDLLEALTRIPASLTATIHSVDAEDVGWLVDAVQPLAGRLVFGGYPTGVRVSWAQHHGGPWPSTTSQHTSVGVTAIRRFLRPFAWQNAPESILPAELRDGEPPVPRREDGMLITPQAVLR
jgi:NADP-dependent aldehyde dehydrogenase